MTGGEGIVQKKQCMMDVMRVVHKTPPPGATKKIVPAAATEAENSRGPLETMLSKVDRIIDNVVLEREMGEDIAAEAAALKLKNIEEPSSESKAFDLQHLGGQQSLKKTFLS